MLWEVRRKYGHSVGDGKGEGRDGQEKGREGDKGKGGEEGREKEEEVGGREGLVRGM